MTAPDDQPAAVQRSVDAIVRQAMTDHLRSLVAGDPARVRDDFAESVRDRIPEFEALAPPGLGGFEMVHDRVDGETSHMFVRLMGAQHQGLEWVWQHIDGRFRIVNVRQTGN
ncbi:MAG: hypothetical protein JOZ39_05620 [Chloroflexi bacterium]|nr:hypothetical protein [Chloroflexota bacterium]